MKKLKLLLVLYGLAMTALAQEKGINFEYHLSWQDVLKKAKKENKNIFLDVYTTWCGPCKRMDKEVYMDKGVGAILNKDFISIKVQMDRTTNDSEQIKARYEDVKLIENKYGITGYPTLIFFNPKGEVVVKHAGFLESKRFIDSAKISQVPGRLYNDEEKAFGDALARQRKDPKNLTKLKTVIGMAKSVRGKKKVEDSLKSVYLDVVRKLGDAKIYQPEVLTMISDATLKENDALLRFFYPDGSKADGIVGKGFSRFVTDKYIRKTYFEKSIYTKGKSLNSLDSIAQIIDVKFSGGYVKRGLLAAKLQWSSIRGKKDLVFRYSTEIIDTFGLEPLAIYGLMLPSDRSFLEINQTIALSVNIVCFNYIFLNPDVKSESLDWGIETMTKLLRGRENDAMVSNGYTLDTMAELLYRRGRVIEAITYKEKAIDFCRRNPEDWGGSYLLEIEEGLQKMKNGIPTWSVKKADTKP